MPIRTDAGEKRSASLAHVERGSRHEGERAGASDEPGGGGEGAGADHCAEAKGGEHPISRSGSCRLPQSVASVNHGQALARFDAQGGQRPPAETRPRLARKTRGRYPTRRPASLSQHGEAPLDAVNIGPVRRDASQRFPEVEVLIEIPRGSFVKRGSTGHVDFVSPLPCPFNYGSVPQLVGLEGDLLDAVVLDRKSTHLNSSHSSVSRMPSSA